MLKKCGERVAVWPSQKSIRCNAYLNRSDSSTISVRHWMNTDLESVCDAADWLVDTEYLNYNSAYIEASRPRANGRGGRLGLRDRSPEIGEHPHDGFRVEPDADEEGRQRVCVCKNAAFDKQHLAGRNGADPYIARMEEWVMVDE